MTKEFFPIGKKQCPLKGLTECTVSFGVWGYECCGVGYLQCCGYISIAGWIAIGAVGVIIVLVILTLICRRR
ncbi:hypothetical protein ANCCAN_12092 [Ancylostoma caninum]|uniref:Uncharacterized protein n=1 Tax=Ancylostoma caninum TaxID=29170 RepID=A0A368GC45_ANCCA|nr:hypothetical protein ANCCAN_12092 [Ancylostoma caninum]